MQKIKLARSDVAITPVIFGAWAIGGWYWGGTDDEQSKRAVHAALDQEITTFDTAPMYGFGHSEKVLGEALKGKRDQVEIATKAGMLWDKEEGEYFFQIPDGPDGKPANIYKNLKPESIRQEVESSLQRLQTDYIDLYQCHWPDKTTPIEDTAEILQKLKDEGKVRAIGVSNFTPAMMSDVLKIAELSSDQPKYNLLDRDIERDVIPYALKNNVSLIVYSPIAQGLLTGKITSERQYPEGDYRQKDPRFHKKFLDNLEPALHVLRVIAEQRGTTAGNVAMAWLLHQSGVTGIIAGIRNERQAEENAQAASISLTKGEVDEIDRAFAKRF